MPRMRCVCVCVHVHVCLCVRMCEYVAVCVCVCVCTSMAVFHFQHRWWCACTCMYANCFHSCSQYGKTAADFAESFGKTVSHANSACPLAIRAGVCIAYCFL